MLIETLKTIEDPRSYHGKEYQLWQILLLSILSILSNGKTYTDIALFAKVHFYTLKTILGLKWRQPPGASAIRKILVRIDPNEIERAFRHYHAHALPLPQGQRHICFDGKSLRGSFSHTRDQRAARVFSAFCVNSQIVLAHLPLSSDKDSEIPAFQQFLLSLALKDVVVTADAIHCQKKLLPALNR